MDRPPAKFPDVRGCHCQTAVVAPKDRCSVQAAVSTLPVGRAARILRILSLHPAVQVLGRCVCLRGRFDYTGSDCDLPVFSDL